MKEIVFVRHGKVENFEKQFIYGNSDILLAEEGIETIRRSGRALQDESFDHVFCSPLTRAKETLAYLRAEGGTWPDTVYDDRLKELNFGRAELKTKEEVDQEMPDVGEKMNDAHQYLYLDFPEGESISYLYTRVSLFLAENVLLPKEEGRYLIVAHSGVIRSAICSLLNLSLNYYWDFYVGFAGIVRIQVDGVDTHHATLMALNEHE